MLDTKILIIDDDTNICELLKLYFENAQGLDDGIALLLEDLDVTLAPDAEVTVTVPSVP